MIEDLNNFTKDVVPYHLKSVVSACYYIVPDPVEHVFVMPCCFCASM